MSLDKYRNMSLEKLQDRRHTLNIKVKDVETLWLLKTIFRCYVKKTCGRDTGELIQYVFGSGKERDPFMSRILMNLNGESLELICLLEDKELCRKVFGCLDRLMNKFIKNTVVTPKFLYNNEEVRGILKECGTKSGGKKREETENRELQNRFDIR
ncbi:hypothetical protein [Metallosphaera hakonensis]|uniref:Uncharacterized protein n=1 Tax=Metallosphaera hakonensis JCM 8857 = DSM 7519 TaxID=1293036 RepID=A0A2U9IR10_9CREN|nr:hypothetical protein [Metallosphaera hakonensis]AWR98460.1 hypothetical protein DFR87_00610 [Metallosphaera hakonensis JCM 8857 = DSM 7519]